MTCNYCKKKIEEGDSYITHEPVGHPAEHFCKPACYNFYHDETPHPVVKKKT